MTEKNYVQKNGLIIAGCNPQPEIRRHAETSADWEYADEAKYLYRMASNFKGRFLNGVIRPDRERLPDPVIAFDDLRNHNTLAAYTLVRNPVGINCEITFNTEHYVDVGLNGKVTKDWRFGRWSQLETLLHEQVHLWQQTPEFGKDPVVLGRVYHNKEFVKKCESLGLHPKLDAGYHTRQADGVFSLYMKELGVKEPEYQMPIKPWKSDWFRVLGGPEKQKGRSTLTKWNCPECGLKLRVGVKSDIEVACMPCTRKTGETTLFVRH